MNIIKGLALTLGAATIMAVSAACSNDSPPPQPNAPSVSTAPAVQTSPRDERQSTGSTVQSISAGGQGQQSAAPAVQASPRLTTSQSTGSTVQPMSSGSMSPYPANVEDLIARGQIIVIGTLDEKFEEIMMGGYGADGQLSEGTMAFTDYQLNIEEVIKGDDTVSAGTESVVLRMFGHKDVQKAVLTSVMSKLPEPGDHLLFALGRNPDGTYGSGGVGGLIDIDSELAVFADGMPLNPFVYGSGIGSTTAELLEQIKALVLKDATAPVGIETLPPRPHPMPPPILVELVTLTEEFTVKFRYEAVAGQPLTVLLVADIVGGPDNSQELYCPGTQWQFGDGIGMSSSASCMVWTPDVKINRHFEQIYTYDAPGTYKVTFTRGPVASETLEVQVR